MTPYRKLEPFNSNIFMIYNHGQFKMPKAAKSLP